MGTMEQQPIAWYDSRGEATARPSDWSLTRPGPGGRHGGPAVRRGLMTLIKEACLTPSTQTPPVSSDLGRALEPEPPFTPRTDGNLSKTCAGEAAFLHGTQAAPPTADGNGTAHPVSPAKHVKEAQAHARPRHLIRAHPGRAAKASPLPPQSFPVMSLSCAPGVLPLPQPPSPAPLLPPALEPPALAPGQVAAVAAAAGIAAAREPWPTKPMTVGGLPATTDPLHGQGTAGRRFPPAPLVMPTGSDAAPVGSQGQSRHRLASGVKPQLQSGLQMYNARGLPYAAADVACASRFPSLAPWLPSLLLPSGAFPECFTALSVSAPGNLPGSIVCSLSCQAGPHGCLCCGGMKPVLVMPGQAGAMLAGPTRDWTQDASAAVKSSGQCMPRVPLAHQSSGIAWSATTEGTGSSEDTREFSKEYMRDCMREVWTGEGSTGPGQGQWTLPNQHPNGTQMPAQSPGFRCRELPCASGSDHGTGTPWTGWLESSTKDCQAGFPAACSAASSIQLPVSACWEGEGKPPAKAPRTLRVGTSTALQEQAEGETKDEVDVEVHLHKMLSLSPRPREGSSPEGHQTFRRMLSLSPTPLPVPRRVPAATSAAKGRKKSFSGPLKGTPECVDTGLAMPAGGRNLERRRARTKKVTWQEPCADEGVATPPLAAAPPSPVPAPEEEEVITSCSASATATASAEDMVGPMQQLLDDGALKEFLGRRVSGVQGCLDWGCPRGKVDHRSRLQRSHGSAELPAADPKGCPPQQPLPASAIDLEEKSHEEHQPECVKPALQVGGASCPSPPPAVHKVGQQWGGDILPKWKAELAMREQWPERWLRVSPREHGAGKEGAVVSGARSVSRKPAVQDTDAKPVSLELQARKAAAPKSTWKAGLGVEGRTRPNGRHSRRQKTSSTQAPKQGEAQGADLPRGAAARARRLRVLEARSKKYDRVALHHSSVLPLEPCPESGEPRQDPASPKQPGPEEAETPCQDPASSEQPGPEQNARQVAPCNGAWPAQGPATSLEPVKDFPQHEHCVPSSTREVDAIESFITPPGRPVAHQTNQAWTDMGNDGSGVSDTLNELFPSFRRNWKPT